MLTISDIRQNFLIALERLADKGKQELAAQGHRASGRGIESIEAQITEQSVTRLVGVILANDYLIPVDTGVSASRVPFGGIGGGGTSRYIQGLLNWIDIIKPGLNFKEAKSFAFAIAHTHKREGTPSNGSYSFSNNGRRKGWIGFGLIQNEQQFEEDLNLFGLIVESFESAIQRAAA